jgi:mannose PTS system EIIA component
VTARSVRDTVGPLVIGLVLVSHGALAQNILETASEIVGHFDPATAIAIERHETLQDIEDRLRAAVRRVDRGHGVLILADMFGGTAANVALELLQDLSVEVVTGFNLPMLLKLSGVMRSSTDLVALAQTVKNYGQRNVLIATEVLKGKGG